MKNAQVINIAGAFPDSVLAFNGDDVIDDTDQLPLASKHIYTDDINVVIYFYDLMGGYPRVSNTVVMKYNTNTDYWLITIADVIEYAVLEDRHKYVGQIVKYDGDSNMRSFKLEEFCVDNDQFEDTWMNLPYQIEIDGTSYIRWYAKGDSDFSETPLFEAPAYQGGTGTTYATSAANVTHRGAITPYEPY